MSALLTIWKLGVVAIEHSAFANALMRPGSTPAPLPRLIDLRRSSVPWLPPRFDSTLLNLKEIELT
jgi:hypothetical protein